jgi:dipeptidyl aminopeptidase/acylaminoacyl peptidase
MIRAALIAIPAALLISTGAYTEAPSIERFMKIRAPNSPMLAPDGTLYVRDWPDGVNQLYRAAPGTPAEKAIGEHMERLTDFEDGLSSYALSPDGKHIILSAATGGSEQNDLYHFCAETTSITPLFTNSQIVYSFQTWLHDSSGFIFTANEESSSDFHIYRYDLDSAERTKLLARTGHWAAIEPTHDGTRVLVAQYISASHADAYELHIANGEMRSLNFDDEPAYNWPAGYLPGEQHAAIITDHEPEGMRQLWVRGLVTREFYKPLPHLSTYEFEGWGTNSARSHVAVTYNQDGYAAMDVYTLPEFNPVQTPEIEQGVISSVNLQRNTVTWTLSNARSPGLAFAWDIGADVARQITAADEQGIDLSEFPLPKLITYESFDGVEVPAFLFLPPGHERSKPIPFVAHYHGGPESQFRPWFSPLIQYLLANGFGIIQPNVRGSTGYGREFHMLDNYTNRWDSVRDGVEAVRWLIDNGYTEAGRVAAYGGSYGGFMSVATVIEGQELFGASVNVVGIVNFITFLEQTRDYRRALREAEYGPLTDREFLASISPINRIDEINVPMLIAHGLNDPRVPVGEAMQLAVGLQRRGHDPEQLYFPDEGHGFAKLENRLLFAERMALFLKRHIGQ